MSIVYICTHKGKCKGKVVSVL